MFGYPYVEAPKRAALSMLPSYMPPKLAGFVTTRIACVPCGLRCDPDMEDVAEFLAEHGPHIREFLESMR